MEGRLIMTEEQVTKSILKWLVDSGWEILDYDFPGGGTGRKFHIGNGRSDKTKGIVIPDVIALRNDVILLFQARQINCISTGCHCCSMKTEHKCASSSANFRNGLEASGKAHHKLWQNHTIFLNQPGPSVAIFRF